MQLRHSPTSPFVRKVMLVLHETGLIDRVDIESVDGWSEPEALTVQNPLSMVPTLCLEDGSFLYDSPVICDYLDRLHDGRPLIPVDGPERWQALRDEALADGILDCAVQVFVETVKRPESLRWDWWLELKQRAITRALDELETRASALSGRLDIGVLSLAVALAYLDLRGAVGDWRPTRPALTHWFTEFSARSSMQATAPS